jgi:hypothetical protein
MAFSVRYEVNIHNVYTEKRLGLLGIKTLINYTHQLHIYSHINQFVHVVCFRVLRADQDVRRTQSNEWHVC